MASPLRAQLRRLRLGHALRVGSRRAHRVHLLVLLAACVLAFTSRALAPLPVLAVLEGRLVPTLLVALGLGLLGGPLRLLALLGRHGDPRRMAAGLDDRLGLKDEASTAFDVDPAPAARPLEAEVVRRATRALAGVEPDRLWKGARPLPWLRAMLALVFAFLLLAPGVDGLWNERGVGRGAPPGLGAREGEPVTGRRDVLAPQAWLGWFVRDPLPVEALPVEAVPDDPRAGGAPR